MKNKVNFKIYKFFIIIKSTSYEKLEEMRANFQELGKNLFSNPLHQALILMNELLLLYVLSSISRARHIHSSFAYFVCICLYNKNLWVYEHKSFSFMRSPWEVPISWNRKIQFNFYFDFFFSIYILLIPLSGRLLTWISQPVRERKKVFHL